jgi:hypothetical protein
MVGKGVGKLQHGESTALEVLEEEDRAIRELLAQIERNRGASVEQRYEYGNLAKQLLRRLAVRESARADVSAAIGDSSLGSLVAPMTAHDSARRELIDRLEALSRGIQGLSLNSGQDFDGPLSELVGLISEEIEWELAEALPCLQRRLSPQDRARLFESAHYIRHHAPTHLHAPGPRWYERAPVVSRLLTVIDHLRDFPRAARGERGI